MREHRYTLDLPHSVDRLWALMQDYPRWTEYAPMVVRVEVLHPGDARGNGLLRRVIYKMPFGRVGSALELVTDVVSPSEARATNGLAGEPQASEARATNGADRERWCGYTYTMISRATGNDQTGRVRLEPVGPRQTRLHFEERYHVVSAPWRWFEGPIYRFINRQNEASMRSLSTWLSGHPEYRPELS
ncbi:MAG TPA: SRPBCC family protein [Myxococcota bacterium]|nr:SRPBCC family protein [Myxococcota bacterium]